MQSPCTVQQILDAMPPDMDDDFWDRQYEEWKDNQKERDEAAQWETR